MGLEKAIEHGKEKRKPYHGPEACDAWCRNHNRCWICRNRRLHKRKVEDERAKDMLGVKDEE